MQIKHNYFLTWLLLFTFSVTNAIPRTDIENLCKETTHATFCVTQIESDPRTAAARDLSDVLVIVMTLSTRQVNDATAHINSIRGKYNGPNGMRRINLCKKNYEIASARFQTAWENELKKSFAEAFKLAGGGTDAVADCESGWGRGGPVQKSPLTIYNKNVIKIYGIIRILALKLGA